jgi:nucleotide-binding universal stress UspA family protein
MTRVLLTAIDGSPAAQRALELLEGYGGDRTRIEPVLLNVQSASLEPSNAILEAAYGRLTRAGASVRIQSAAGAPAPAILAEATRQEADAIVMGTRGAGALQGFALGSVALRVVHRARLPVILVKPEDRLPKDLGQKLKVLLAMDGSEPAVRAAKCLVAWRDWLGELDIQIAWVQQPLTYLETVLPPHDDVIAAWGTDDGERAAQPARALFRRNAIAHHLHLTVGDAAEELALLADRTGADLIALGKRGRGAAYHAFIGSVSLKSAALAGVPVLIVP